VTTNPIRRATALAATLAVAGALAVGCASDDGSTVSGSGAELAPPVEALPARSGALPLEERVSGIVKAENQVTIRPEIEATILEVYVRSGEAVEQGQPLVRLRQDTPREQLRQAEAAVRLAEAAAKGAQARVAELEAQVVRTRALAEQQLVSELEVETLEAQLAAAQADAAEAAAEVERARATVEERRAVIDRTIVRAPVAGRLGQREAEVGMLVDPGTPLFVLGNLDRLIVEVPLTESMLAYLDPGMPVRISSPALPGGAVEATLSRISPFLEQGSFSTTGEIDLTNPGGRLRPGMFVTVDVLYGQTEEATLVPTSALWEEPRTDRRGVFVVEFPEGERPAEPASTGELGPKPVPVSFRQLEVVAEGRGTAGVRGLDPGEWVVTVGQHLLRTDGSSLARVRPTSWVRVLELQGLQREDLLEQFLDEQQQWARERGAEPPSNTEFVRGGSPAGS
jgi:RND family efflux transporter MFP subunit